MNEMITLCHSLNNNTRTGLVISLCLNANRMASNFRHLLSCGTIENMISLDNSKCIEFKFL